ncbi:MAG: four helix bundle protein [Bacteroidota bacterium]
MVVQKPNESYRERTKAFTLKIIEFYVSLPKGSIKYILGKQLLRSASSSAANYRAACLARSVKERYSKMCIVVEEADETQFWLELFLESEITFQNNLESLLKEAEEIAKIMTSYRFKLKQGLNN